MTVYKHKKLHLQDCPSKSEQKEKVASIITFHSIVLQYYWPQFLLGHSQNKFCVEVPPQYLFVQMEEKYGHPRSLAPAKI
jgi:hypothetical protein